MTALLEPGLAPPDEADPAEKPQVSRFRFGVSFAVLLLATGALYLIDLGRSGWANAFYSAATQAGAHSWKAFFFGSSDASNFITVDKPPAALWVTDLSARIFGVNSWSILVPEALMGVGAVALLVLTVRRWSGDAAGLVAGLALAATPVAALMFRFNNPDALLVLLLIASFYAITRALETGHTRWLVLAAVFIGNAFLAKMLQAFLVVPALALGYLALGPATWRRRFVQLVYAGLALAASAGWWLVAVTLIPAADRPYIGGSQNNSIWNLLFGYNGFGRLSGNEAGSVGGGARPGGGGGWGATGLTRLFGSEMGGQISWLLPGALVLLVSGLWLTRHAARSDRSRAGLLLWGGWLAVTGATFSFGAGIIHPYYTVALAPAIAALVGIGGKLSWDARSRAVGRAALSVAIAGSVSWGYLLLDRSPMFHPWLRGVALAVGLLAALTVAVPFGWARRVTVVGLVAGIAAGLAGPAAFAIETASTPHTGAIPSAGPATRGGFGPGPGGAGLRAGRGGAGGFRGGVPPGAGAQGGFGQGGLARGGLARGSGGPAAGGPTAGRPAAGGGPGGGGPGGFGGAGSRGGIGGLLNGSESNPILTAALRAGGTTYAWAAATTGSNNAAGYQLASGEPVMAIGGFNGTDPAPSLAAFEKDVSAGRIHYYIASSGFGGGGRGATTSDPAGQISDWVEANFTAASLGGTTTYDLTRPAA